MRIYKIEVEHKTHGVNWTSYKIAARTFKEATRRVKKFLSKREVITSVQLLESTD